MKHAHTLPYNEFCGACNPESEISIDLAKPGSDRTVIQVGEERIVLTPEMTADMRRKAAEFITNIPPRGTLAYQMLLLKRQTQRLWLSFLSLFS